MKNKYLILGDGSSPHILKWVKELVKYFDLYLISLNGVDSQIYDYLVDDSVFVLNEKVKSEGGNYQLIFKVMKIRSIVSQIEPNYINAHYLSSYGFLAALSKGAAPQAILMQSTWGSDVLLTPFKNFVNKKVAQFSLNRADYITSDSWYMAEVIKELVGEKEIIVFPFGFDSLDRGLEEKENMIFSNRSLKPLYNIENIIKWFANQDKKYQLIIANDGTQRGSLEILAKELEISHRVKFVGFLSSEEQKYYYQKSTYYISIPTSDATSVSLLEAMQYGTIPIVSNIPANREWILDGVNGLYFDINQNLDTIIIEKNFDKINYNLLKNKALFSKSIAYLISKVRK